MPEMRTAQMNGPGKPLSLAERPVPQPGPGEILIRTIACGMCFTEVNLLHGHYPFARFPPSDTVNRNLAISSRDAVASKMKPEEIAEAQQRAGQWTPK